MKSVSRIDMEFQDKIKHLYNRACFGVPLNTVSSKQEIKDIIHHLIYAKSTHTTLQVASLEEVEKLQADIKSMPKETAKELRKAIRDRQVQLNQLWFEQMVNSSNTLQEKMALFWHGHFACRSSNPFFDQQYVEIIRKNALGNFGTLLKEISKSPSMLQFLNNQQNKKEHPNENFAREVMELFTIGRGNYTEHDIKEAARAFTGFAFDKSAQFIFRKKQHDDGVKLIFGKTGNFDGDDVLEMLLEKKECAHFIATKVYRFFVNDVVNENNVQQLSDVFYNSGYDIQKLLHAIFSSNWFYNIENRGCKIKSPIELLVGYTRIIPFQFTDNKSNVFIQKSLGQELLNPPNVAGWPGGKNWIDSSLLLFRMRLPQALYFEQAINFTPKATIAEVYSYTNNTIMDSYIKFAVKKIKTQFDWSAIVQQFNASSDVVKDISNTILISPPSQASLSAVRKSIESYTSESAIKSAAISIMSLLEYQLC